MTIRHELSEIVLKSYRLDPVLDELPTLGDLLQVAKVMGHEPDSITILYPQCGLHTIELVVIYPLENS